MNRRAFLIGASALGLTMAGGFALSRRSTIDLSDIGERRRLAMPQLIDTIHTGKFELTAMAGETRFGGGGASTTVGYNQPFLGPVVRLKSGSLRATVTNRYDEPVTVHWHGLLVPGVADGGPHLPISTGETWRPELTVSQAPSTAWFHTHIHGRTAKQVYSGLAGGLIIGDGRDDERAIPSNYGVDDLYLILQDRQFAPDGQMIYGLGMMGQMHGFSGETMLVNGQFGSVAAVPKGIVRLRLLNGSNARILTLGLSDGRPMHLIASDGGYLPKPVPLEEFRLSPGERAEVLVDFGDGRSVALVSRTDPNSGPSGMMGRFQSVYTRLLGSVFEVLPFIVDHRMKARISSVPSDLDGDTPNLTRDVSKVRRLSLDMNVGGDMMGGPMGINGKPFDMDRVDLSVQFGSVELWHVSSPMLAHPFHVHGAMFQVLSENGGTPRPENGGWKDTVLINSDAELLVRFDQLAPPEKPFMFHCHNLEHEDAGMMGQFTVT